MDSERELKFLAAVWALRGILTRPGFKKFKLKDRCVGSDKGELDDLLDYVKAKETPATVQLLSANSRTTIEKGVEAVTLTRNGIFFKNFADLGKLLKLTVAEGDILLFVMLWREEPGLRQALDEINSCGVQEFYDHLARILKVPEVEIRLAVRKDGTLATAGLVEVYKGVHRSVELEPLEGLYKALSKPEGGVEGILGTYFTKSPAPTLSLEDFAHHPDLSLLVRYVRQAVKRREPGTNILLYGSPGTGKTELVRTLADHVQARLFEVSTEDGDGEGLGGGQRLGSYLLSQRVLSQAPDTLLLFDEIEDAFPWPNFFPLTPMHHDNSLKGWTNRLLESNPVPAVWICNHLDGIDPAHVRRFDLVIEVPVPPLQAREKMVNSRLGRLKVDGGFLRGLAANVHLAPGHIDKAAKVADYCHPRTPEDTGKILKAVIRNVHKALNLKPGKGFRQPLDSSYSLAHINADHDLDGLVKSCRRSLAVRLFLHGPPGTGKTAFVQYLILSRSQLTINNPIKPRG